MAARPHRRLHRHAPDGSSEGARLGLLRQEQLVSTGVQHHTRQRVTWCVQPCGTNTESLFLSPRGSESRQEARKRQAVRGLKSGASSLLTAQQRPVRAKPQEAAPPGPGPLPPGDEDGRVRGPQLPRPHAAALPPDRHRSAGAPGASLSDSGGAAVPSAPAHEHLKCHPRPPRQTQGRNAAGQELLRGTLLEERRRWCSPGIGTDEEQRRLPGREHRLPHRARHPVKHEGGAGHAATSSQSPGSGCTVSLGRADGFLAKPRPLQ